MKRIIITILSIIMLLQPISFSVSPTTVNAAKNDTSHGMGQGLNPKNITAESAIVMDINSGAILYEKNMDDKHYPASITKIMTTLLCLENSSLTDKVLFSAHAVNSIEPGSSHISIVPNEIMPMEDCLYGIMLMSANEACNGVAEHVAGSIPAFVDMMNAKAKSLGCKNTHFNNPNGLFDEKHYTTAYDMALIGKAAMQNPVFRKITGSGTYTIKKTNLMEERYMYNKHNMLHPVMYPKYGYKYCIGGKTGYTDIARWTLVTFTRKDDLELVTVVMKTAGPPNTEPNEYTDTLKLVNYAYDNFKSYPIKSSFDNNDAEGRYSLFTKYDSIFDEKDSPLYLQDNASVVLPNDVDISQATKNIEYYNNVTINEGINEIGCIKYTYNGFEVGNAKILYDTSKVTKTDLNQEISNYINTKLAEKTASSNNTDNTGDNADNSLPGGNVNNANNANNTDSVDNNLSDSNNANNTDNIDNNLSDDNNANNTDNIDNNLSDGNNANNTDNIDSNLSDGNNANNINNADSSLSGGSNAGNTDNSNSDGKPVTDSSLTTSESSKTSLSFWKIILIAVAAIILLIFIINLVYRARLHKKYFGTYNRFSKKSRLKYINKTNKKFKKNNRW